MKILILDDEAERHAGFKRLLSGHLLFHAHTSFQFKDLVQNNGPFDLIFWDHDLGEVIPEMYGSSEITGASLACWLLRQPKELWPKTAWVHSHNPSGAEDIVRILTGKIPEVIRYPYEAPK